MQETTARVQFDKKYLIALVLPLVIEQVLAVTVGMADMIMVSGAGDTAVFIQVRGGRRGRCIPCQYDQQFVDLHI